MGLDSSQRCPVKRQRATSATGTQKIPSDPEEKASLRMMEPWNRLAREVVESSCLDILKTCLDTILWNLLWVNLFLAEGLDQKSLPTPTILWFSVKQNILGHFKCHKRFGNWVKQWTFVWAATIQKDFTFFGSCQIAASSMWKDRTCEQCLLSTVLLQ